MPLRHSPRLALTLLAASAATAMLALSGTSHAAENRVQRYTAGIGGSDMTSPVSAGWYGQVAMIHYHAAKLKAADGSNYNANGRATVAPGLTVPYTAPITNFRADAYVLLPRVTYISTQKWLGANTGFTVMLPLVERQTSITSNAAVSPTVAGLLGPTNTAALLARVNGTVDAKSGSNTGVGDLEFAPLLHWEIDDHQSATLTPTVILPTGEYDKSNPVNPGFGRFYTFRPSFQYGYIGDGWDVGARAVLSFNSRNKSTGTKSGDMFNLDFAFMKFVTDDIRLGVQGYVVQQLNQDESTDATRQAEINAADGNKMSVYALGPALAWIVNGGEMLVEGKVLHEMRARNRSEGNTYMLTISKPFGL
jgi:hypothetical protein